MGIVIVEGPDGAGKTTLLRNLRAESKTYFWVASSSRRPRDLQEIQDAIHWIGQAAYLRLKVVCDRFPVISESVYGPIMRGASLLDSLSLRDKQHATALIVEEIDRVIYCRPSFDTIKKNLAANPQMEGVSNRIRQLVDAYDNIMDGLRDDGVKVYSYDYTGAALTMKYAGRTCDLNKLFFGEPGHG